MYKWKQLCNMIKLQRHYHLLQLTGVMIISVGTTIYAVYENFSHFLDPSYFSPATVLIVVGILVFIIAFMGCCGALRESTCMVLVVSEYLIFLLCFKYFLSDTCATFMYALLVCNLAVVCLDNGTCRCRCCVCLAGWYQGSPGWEYQSNNVSIRKGWGNQVRNRFYAIQGKIIDHSGSSIIIAPRSVGSLSHFCLV